MKAMAVLCVKMDYSFLSVTINTELEDAEKTKETIANLTSGRAVLLEEKTDLTKKVIKK